MAEKELKKREPSEVRTKEEPRERFIRPWTSIREYDDSVKIVMDVPGVSKENMDIQYNRGELTITGRKEAWDREKMRPYYVERFEGNYKRVFSIDDTLDPENISAKLSRGVLELTIPKIEAVKPKKIEIKTN